MRWSIALHSLGACAVTALSGLTPLVPGERFRPSSLVVLLLQVQLAADGVGDLLILYLFPSTLVVLGALVKYVLLELIDTCGAVVVRKYHVRVRRVISTM